MQVALVFVWRGYTADLGKTVKSKMIGINFLYMYWGHCIYQNSKVSDNAHNVYKNYI